MTCSARTAAASHRALGICEVSVSAKADKNGYVPANTVCVVQKLALSTEDECRTHILNGDQGVQALFNSTEGTGSAS